MTGCMTDDDEEPPANTLAKACFAHRGNPAMAFSFMTCCNVISSTVTPNTLSSMEQKGSSL